MPGGFNRNATSWLKKAAEPIFCPQASFFTDIPVISPGRWIPPPKDPRLLLDSYLQFFGIFEKFLFWQVSWHRWSLFRLDDRGPITGGLKWSSVRAWRCNSPALFDSVFPKEKARYCPAHEKQRGTKPQNWKAQTANPKPSSTKVYGLGSGPALTLAGG